MSERGSFLERLETMWDVITMHMDWDIREKVHDEVIDKDISGNEAFLNRYCELDPDFEDFLKTELSIEL